MADLAAQRIVHTASLRDKALEILRQSIVSGQIVVGELYSATALAKELGVSASPVREAMLTLVNEGTMEAVRNRGFRIAPLTENDLAEVFELRVMLEVPAMRQLADADLSAHLGRMEQLVALTEDTARVGDVREFLARDREFHLELLALRGNSRLVGLVALLRDQTRLFGLGIASNSSLLEAAAAEHRSLVVALVGGDADLAEQIMASHLRHIQNEWSFGSGATQPAHEA